MNSLKLIAVAAFLAGISAGYRDRAHHRPEGQGVLAERGLDQEGRNTGVRERRQHRPQRAVDLAAHRFNLGLIQPGHSTPVTFKNAGDLNIICAIHPTMKMVVKVAE